MPDINWGILDQNAPANVANSLYQGQQQAAQNKLMQAQLQQAQGANALQQYQLSSAQRNDALQNKMLADLQAANGDPDAIKNALIRAGKPQDAFKLQTDQANLQKINAETAIKHLEARKQLSGAVFASPTQDNALSAISQFEKMTGQDLSQEKQNIVSMNGNPEAIKQWAAGHAIEADKLLPHFEQVDQGGTKQLGTVDPLSGKFTANAQINKTVSPDAVLHANTQKQIAGMVDARQRELNGIMADGQANEDVNRMAQGIANGQLAPLSGFALSTPRGRMIMSKVLEINPNYSAQSYATSQQASNAFAKGQQGNTTRAIGVAMDHIGTLSPLVDALKNGDLKLINKFANAYADQTGEPAPTNFNAAKVLVANEITKAVLGSAGALGDREKVDKVLSDVNSPEQLQGVINTYQALMAGQLRGLERQYKGATGKDDFQDRYLSDDAKKLIKKGHSVDGSQSQQSQGLPSGWSVEAH